MKIQEKTILGLTEKVTLYNMEKEPIEIVARIDTGAQNSSIDQALAAELRLGPIIKSKKIKQSSGITVRPVIETEVSLQGKRITAEFTISNREHMKYQALIGQNILKHGFLIDPSRSEEK